jgi:hypothetical protein
LLVYKSTTLVPIKSGTYLLNSLTGLKTNFPSQPVPLKLMLLQVSPIKLYAVLFGPTHATGPVQTIVPLRAASYKFNLVLRAPYFRNPNPETLFNDLPKTNRSNWTVLQ